MALKQQLFFIIASILTFIFIIRKIQKKHLNIAEAISWILWSLLLLVLSIFPQLAKICSDFLGFMSTSNFIFSLFIFFLYIMLFSQMIQISQLKDKEQDLVQKLSLKDYQERKGKEE